MATTTSLVDDLDGTPAEETVRFGLDNAEYEIDLNAANAAELRETLAPYVSVARRAKDKDKGQGRGKGRGKGGDRGKSHEIREWALANGYELAQRGRIPTHIVEAYEAAQPAA